MTGYDYPLNFEQGEGYISTESGELMWKPNSESSAAGWNNTDGFATHKYVTKTFNKKAIIETFIT